MFSNRDLAKKVEELSERVRELEIQKHVDKINPRPDLSSLTQRVARIEHTVEILNSIVPKPEYRLIFTDRVDPVFDAPQPGFDKLQDDGWRMVGVLDKGSTQIWIKHPKVDKKLD